MSYSVKPLAKEMESFGYRYGIGSPSIDLKEYSIWDSN